MSVSTLTDTIIFMQLAVNSRLEVHSGTFYERFSGSFCAQTHAFIAKEPVETYAKCTVVCNLLIRYRLDGMTPLVYYQKARRTPNECCERQSIFSNHFPIAIHSTYTFSLLIFMSVWYLSLSTRVC